MSRSACGGSPVIPECPRRSALAEPQVHQAGASALDQPEEHQVGREPRHVRQRADPVCLLEFARSGRVPVDTVKREPARVRLPFKRLRRPGTGRTPPWTAGNTWPTPRATRARYRDRSNMVVSGAPIDRPRSIRDSAWTHPISHGCWITDPDWNDLRWVLAVHEAGSLSAAARALGVSRSSMSRRIAVIEAGGRPVFRPAGVSPGGARRW